MILIPGCITVTPPGGQEAESGGAQPPVISTFSASPGNIVSGQVSTLSWQVSGASTVSITGIGNVALTGTQVISPGMSTTYTLTATNQAGSATATTQIILSATAPTTPTTPTIPKTPTTPTTPALTAPPLITFTASPTSIQPGGSATLQWNAVGATTVWLNLQTVPATGTKSVSPTSTTTYTLRATNAAGTVAKAASVAVVQGSSPGTTTLDPGTTIPVSPGITSPGITDIMQQPTASIFASGSRVQQGQSATLQWNVSGATEVSLVGSGGDVFFESVAATGTKSVSPTSTSTYTLKATNAVGTTTVAVSVYVTTPLVTFSASPNPVESGQSTTLVWNVTGMTPPVSVSINQGIGAVAAAGTKSVTPTGTTTYTLTAGDGAGRTATQSVSVGVTVTIQNPNILPYNP